MFLIFVIPAGLTIRWRLDRFRGPRMGLLAPCLCSRGGDSPPSTGLSRIRYRSFTARADRSSGPHPGGNMEGKEVATASPNRPLFATITTDASCGAVNTMHDSLTRWGGNGGAHH